MPDEPTEQSTRKRRVKNPESFRERALKATSEIDKPQKERFFTRILRFIFKPIRAFFRILWNAPLIKSLHKPLIFVGKIIVPAYFRNSWKELKQVTWPTWVESIRLTWAVLLFAIIFGAAVAVVDFGLDKVFKQILLK
jgi:preprotein translocase SecE subunit